MATAIRRQFPVERIARHGHGAPGGQPITPLSAVAELLENVSPDQRENAVTGIVSQSAGINGTTPAEFPVNVVLVIVNVPLVEQAAAMKSAAPDR